MSRTVTVSYNLNPPADVVTRDAYPPSKVHEITVTTTGSQSHSEYYKALREAVVRAKTQIGADLTVWRDAVGSLENSKEPKKGQNGENEDEEEGDEEP